jgi:2-octaprenyl-6-methoxyphenol hydroxylase
MYIVQNNKFKNTLSNIVIKKKNIKILKSAITKINFNSGSVYVKNKKIIYDLIVLSVGSQSFLYNKIDQGRSIKKDYKEVAITAFVKHNSKIENPSQFFLKEGPLAILPLKKNVFSLVWSVNYNFFNKNKKNIKILIDKKINEILDKKVKKKISNINNFNIYLNLKKKYFKKNTLIIGDGLHAVHPIAGQGFNLVLRDIMKLKELINKNLKLGLLMKESAILKDFYQARKPENTLVGLGIDLTNTFFKENKIFSPLKDLLLRNLNNFQFIKKISKKIADSGVR